VSILESTKKTLKWKFWHRRRIWLDCKQQSISANLGLLWGKSDLEPNTRVIEHSLFPTVIYTPWYDKRSKSYDFLNISQATISLCWQTEITWENCIFTTKHYHIRKHAIPNLYITFSTFHSLLIRSNPINVEEVTIIGTQCTGGRTLDTASDLDWWRSRKTLLTNHGAESRGIHNMKVIENFEVFPGRINTPSYDQRFRSYGHCKLGVLLKLSSGQTVASQAISTLYQMQNET
jgi:hypothetical protein